MIRKARLGLISGWHAINAWLVGLQGHRIPQLLVLICGLTNCGLSVLFLRFPDRIDTTPGLRYLATALSTDWWVVIFGAIGVMQATLAVARYTVAAVPCVLSGVAMATFCVLSSFNFIFGPAAGIVTVMSLSLAVINVLAAGGSIAPSQVRATSEYLDRHGD